MSGRHRRPHATWPSVWVRVASTGLVVGLVTAVLAGGASAVLTTDPAAAATGDELTSSAVTLTTKDDALVAEGSPFPISP